MNTSVNLGISYAVITTNKQWLKAIKMEAGMPGPHFITVRNDCDIYTEDDERLQVADLCVGDRFNVMSARPIKPFDKVPMLTEPLTWDTQGQPRAQAIATTIIIEQLAEREEKLAFVRTFNEQAARIRYRFYDPYQQAERPLPKNVAGPLLKDNELVKVKFVRHDPGTFSDQFGQVRIPAKCPFAPPHMLALRHVEYEPVSYETFTEAQYKALSGFLENPSASVLEPSLVDDLLLAGAAVMQGCIKRENTLEQNTVSPSIEHYGAEFVLFAAEYIPTTKKNRADLTRAARVLKEEQRVLVMPAEDNTGLKGDYVSALITQSEATALGTIKFKFTIPTHTVESVWRFGVDADLGGRPWLIKAAPSSVTTKAFREMLQERAITKLRNSEERTPSARIIDALLGKADALSQPPDIPTPWICLGDSILTHEQAEGVAKATEDEIPLSVLLAPAGSGKSTTITAVIQETLKKEENPGIVATANMNVAIDSLATKLMGLEQMKKKRVLVLQSAAYLARCQVTDPYQRWRLPELLRRLATGKIDSKMNRAEVDLAKKAACAAKYRFHMLDMDWTCALKGSEDEPGDEDFEKGIKLLIKKYRPQVILGTTAMLKQLAEALDETVRRVICDESGTIATIDVIHMLAAWKQTASVMLVGDVKQLGNFAAPMDKELRKFGFDSVLMRAAALPNAAKTTLTEVYRSHPAIVALLSKFAYTETPLKTHITHEMRSLMTELGIRMADPKLPIIVIDCSEMHKPTLLKSYTNPQQVEIGTQIAALIASRSQTADVRLMTLYSGIRDDLRKTLSSLGIGYPVSAIDASQGQEVDISIVATAFTPVRDGYEADTFVGATERITVAISRARHGLILLANVEALSRSTEWERLFETIREMSSGSFIKPNELFKAETAGGSGARPGPTEEDQQRITLAIQALGVGRGLEEEAPEEEEPVGRKRNSTRPKSSRTKTGRK